MRPGCIATGGRATWRAGTLPAAGSALSALLGTQLSRDRPSQSSSTDLGRGSKRNKSQKLCASCTPPSWDPVRCCEMHRVHPG